MLTKLGTNRGVQKAAIGLSRKAGKDARVASGMVQRANVGKVMSSSQSRSASRLATNAALATAGGSAGADMMGRDELDRALNSRQGFLDYFINEPVASLKNLSGKGKRKMADIRGTSGDNYKRDELGYAAVVDQMRNNDPTRVSDPTRATDIIVPKREKVSPLTGKQNPGSANAEYLAAVAKLSPKSTRGERQAVENLGMDAYAKAYPELYAKSQKQTYNPLMQSTFGYQTGEAPDQLRKIGITPDMDPAAEKDADDGLAGLLPANQEESDAYKAGYDIGASQFLKSQLLDLGNKTVQDYAVKTKQSQIYDKVLTPETQPFTNENIMSHGINMPAPEGIWQYSEQTPFTMPLEEDADFGALVSDPNALGGFLADNFKSAYR